VRITIIGPETKLSIKRPEIRLASTLKPDAGTNSTFGRRLKERIIKEH
jgi:hypothetical protein